MEREAVSATTDLYRKHGIGRATLTSGVRRPGGVGSCAFAGGENRRLKKVSVGDDAGRGDAERRLQRTDALCRVSQQGGAVRSGWTGPSPATKVVDRTTPVHTRLRELAAMRRRDASLLAFYRACTLMTSCPIRKFTSIPSRSERSRVLNQT